ncbi:MAG: DUF2591 domain-containing protein [Mesorhizobium sp.]|nr:MAG: DUF2591 domain-containing protein [Mesorhizobium sp.]
MKYEEMSDFEINKAVGEIALEGKWACKPGHSGNESDSWHYGSVAEFVTPYPQLPDYCNSWGDAGPIIEKHGISLYRIDENDNPFIKDEEVVGLWFSCGPMVAGYGDPEPIKDGLSCQHKNPLRAAMITFLMMQEGK